MTSLWVKVVGVSLYSLIIYFLLVRLKKRRPTFNDGVTSIAFFHPYCNSGGGGERVLWLAISSLLSSALLKERIKIVVYSGDSGISANEIIANARVSVCLVLNTFFLFFQHSSALFIAAETFSHRIARGTGFQDKVCFHSQSISTGSSLVSRGNNAVSIHRIHAGEPRVLVSLHSRRVLRLHRLCIHLPRRASGGRLSRGGLRALPNHLLRHAAAGA